MTMAEQYEQKNKLKNDDNATMADRYARGEFIPFPEEEGLGYGVIEDTLMGAPIGAAVGFAAPYIAKAGKYGKDIPFIGKWIDDMAMWGKKQLGQAKTLEPNIVREEAEVIRNIKKNTGGNSRPEIEEDSLNRVINYRNKIINKSDNVDQSVQHIDPRWYDPRQDVKKVRMGGVEDDDVLTRSMYSRIVPLSQTKNDILKRVDNISAAKKAYEMDDLYIPKNQTALETSAAGWGVGNGTPLHRATTEPIKSRINTMSDEIDQLKGMAQTAGGSGLNIAKSGATATLGGLFGGPVGATVGAVTPKIAKSGDLLMKIIARDNYVKDIAKSAGVSGKDIIPYLQSPFKNTVQMLKRTGAGAGSGALINAISGQIMDDDIVSSIINSWSSEPKGGK